MHAIKLIAVGLVLALPSAALAQATEGMVEGAGYKVGEGSVVHPSVGLEMGYVSNVFYEEDSQEPVGAGIIRVLAELSLASLPPQRLGVTKSGDTELAAGGLGTPSRMVGSGSPPQIEYRLGLKLAYEEYLSDEQFVTDQRNLSGGLDAAVTLFPQGTFRFGGTDSFTRHTRPVNFESSGNLNRDINRLKLSLGWYPEGRTINGTLRYENLIDKFESEESSFADRIQHTIGAMFDWRYLPMTRFYLDASQGFYGQLGDATLMGQRFKSDSAPLRLVIGGESALSEITTVRLHAGFAAGFYSEGPSYSSAVYGAEFGLRYSPLGRIIVNFDREFRDSINANFYSEYLFRARLQHQISLVLATASASAALRRYEGISSALSTEPARDDLLFSAGVDARYFARDWLAIGVGYNLVLDETDFRYDVDGRTDDPSYVRQELGASVSAAF